MEEVFIKGKAYTFIKNYKNDDKLRTSFNNLTQNTFGFNFEEWYQSGYWGENYIPYSLLDGEKVIANVSVSIMEFVQLGKNKRYIQIGTVMTDLDYRNRGLSKYLMEKVIEEYKDNCHDIYLFANDSVLVFYPKFGFKSITEYEYSKDISYDNKSNVAEKLDMTILKNRDLLVNKVINSVPISKLSMVNNSGLIMFYCTSYFQDKVYYLGEEDSIVIAEYEDEKLLIYDLFGEQESDLDSIIYSLSNENVRKVVLGFTPNNAEGYDVKFLNNDDCTLFVLKKEIDLIKNKLRFPTLSHT